MRPTRLEIEGFTAFKEPTVVDLSDADYFALVGATGSGKSTIIDAICFALYGLVPRYGSKTLVWPVISQGALETKVRLDFTVGGEAYTAVRVVKRAGANRANTKEARLEHNGEVIAGTADELSAAIGGVIGLSFEHFTRCVVLPQGEFARFLHDKPADRQEVLVKLLNLGVYDRMRHAAASLAANRKNEVALRRQRIDEDFSFATDEALAEKKGAVEKLGDLREQVAAMTPKLLELDAREVKADETIAETTSAIELLTDLELPDDVDELARHLKEAEAALRAAEEQVADRKSAAERALKARASLPEAAPLHTTLKTYERADALEGRVREATTDVEKATKVLQAATDEAAAAQSALEASIAAAEEAQRDHLAAHLAEGLQIGHSCPVCMQNVATVPKHATPGDLSKAKDRVVRATAGRNATSEVVSEASKALAAAEGGLAQLERELDAVRGDLSDTPEREQLEKTLAAIAAADEALEATRRDESSAADRCEAERNSLVSLDADRAAATKDFHAARDRVAHLKPPAAGHDDLAADWAALVAWAAKLIPMLEKAADQARSVLASIGSEKDAVFRTIAEACELCAVDLTDGDPKEAVASELARARSDVERIEQALADKAKLEREAADLQVEHDVTNELALHLKSDRFQRWVVSAALQRLVVGATEILRELSGGQYSLVVDDSGHFLVKDHDNADETRLAKTLSGGETFLASLSLALALSDQLVDLAAAGSARLESLFLDEGFGTLDAGTLDTVAATVENLAASGRMVGIVTHVRELADRVPMQFRVTKGARTSTVEKVIA